MLHLPIYSYNPLLCVEANSSYPWDTELRPGNAGTWDGSLELLETCFVMGRYVYRAGLRIWI